MKDLSKKYKKFKSQFKLECEIGISNKKLSLWMYNNLIGYSMEYYIIVCKINNSNPFNRYIRKQNRVIDDYNKKLLKRNKLK